MNIKTHILRTSKRLEPYINLLEKTTELSIKKVKELLPIDDVDIVLYDTFDKDTSVDHIYGYTPNAHVVFVYLNPGVKDFEKIVKEDLGKTLAHELHHSVRWRNPGYGANLLEALVTEGLAEHFAKEVDNSGTEPWTKVLSKNEIQKLLHLAKENFHKHYNHDEWFFGANGKFLYWTGYSLGYEIVGEYLKNHPQEKASTLYNASAKLFE